MKKHLPFLFSLALLASAGTAGAQTYITQSGASDSAAMHYNGIDDMSVYNKIRSNSATPVVLQWHVTGVYFGPSWRFGGICDNVLCYADSVNVLSGNNYTTDPYDNASWGDYHVIYNNLVAAPWNTHSYIRVQMKDTATGGTTRNLWFIGYKNAAGVTATFSSDEDVVMFPNPARETVNILYNEQAGVRQIGLYDRVGKLVRTYPAAGRNSTSLDLGNVPSGLYILRLADTHGRIVATRRLNRQ